MRTRVQHNMQFVVTMIHYICIFKPSFFWEHLTFIKTCHKSFHVMFSVTQEKNGRVTANIQKKLTTPTVVKICLHCFCFDRLPN